MCCSIQFYGHPAIFLAGALGWCLYALALFLLVAAGCMIYRTLARRWRRGEITLDDLVWKSSTPQRPLTPEEAEELKRLRDKFRETNADICDLK